MNYIVFDLEFNQDYSAIKGNKNRIPSKCPFEIIQIGAIKLDENLQTIGSLDRLIKPEIFTDLNPFVEEITGITMEQLNTARTFKEVYMELAELLKSERTILCVWGAADIKELFRNIEYHELDMSVVPKEYINLQSYVSRFLNYQKGLSIGLRTAVELLNIPLNNQFHDAFNDAYYTAEILKKVNSEAIKITLYNRDTYKRLNTNKIVKHKIDTIKLITQFERMFNREMTSEEKSIIKLAYIMGKTKQFQIEAPEKSQ